MVGEPARDRVREGVVRRRGPVEMHGPAFAALAGGDLRADPVEARVGRPRVDLHRAYISRVGREAKPETVSGRGS